MRQASEEAAAPIADFRGENGPVKGLTGNLQQTLHSARDAMADLAETTEALKRNFFFRGFFNSRGYFDLDDVSVRSTGRVRSRRRTGGCCASGSSADVLFERDANGVERLSEGGRVRLDSAMSQFVRYPQKSPFVVEGYAHGRDRRRALSHQPDAGQLVRDYIVGKFGLDPNYVATMPMGAEAPEARRAGTGTAWRWRCSWQPSALRQTVGPSAVDRRCRLGRANRHAL